MRDPGSLGAAVGLAATWLSLGDVGWSAALPVLVVAAAAAPVLGALLAGRAGAPGTPANRTARLAVARALRLRRLAVEATVLIAATLSFVALRQRGVAGLDGDGDLTAASAPTWWVVAGTLVVLRLLPTGIRLGLRTTGGSVGGVPFFVAARLAETASKVLPVLVVTVAVAQLTVAAAVAATEHRGQAEGALIAVGGDARLTAAPGDAVGDTARDVAAASGVRAAVAARVADGVLASSPASTASVRLVVVDAVGYERLLRSSDLPDAPQLGRLTAAAADRVPALLLGGDAELSDHLVVRWEGTAVPLDVVGVAPRVNGSIDPVVVVDVRAFAAAGAAVQPDTLWAVGPGAAAAVESAEQELASPSSSHVVRYTEELDARRTAPLPSGLLRLAVAAACLLMLLGVLGVALAAAAQAPGRGESLGRLRALGLRDRDVARVRAGELVTPVAIAAAIGLMLGISCAYAMSGSFSLERITGQAGPPRLVVPWWTSLAGAVLLGAVLLAAAVEGRRLRRRALAELLRS